MSDKLMNEKVGLKPSSFNWPVVGFLLFMTGIPAIPGAFILILIALGPSSGFSISSGINVLHFETPAAIFVHGGAGIIFFLTMPFQFSPAIRNRKKSLHKTIGKIALLSGYVMAISGIWMHHVLWPDLFGARYISLLVLCFAMCISFSIAFWYIINGNVQYHQKWMCRAVAITLGAVTPIFVDVILYLLFGQFESVIESLGQFQHDYGRLVGIVINLTVVEYLFVRKERKEKTRVFEHTRKI